ncbi:hypothetical protein D3C85_1579630 [compost metagenome]
MRAIVLLPLTIAGRHSSVKLADADRTGLNLPQPSFVLSPKKLPPQCIEVFVQIMHLPMLHQVGHLVFNVRLGVKHELWLKSVHERVQLVCDCYSVL